MKSFFTKSLCSIAFLLTCNLFVFAQSIELPNVSRNSFSGVQKMDQTGYYVKYVENGGTNKVLLKIVTLDNKLAKTGEFTFNFKGDEKLEDLTYSDSKFLFITSSYSARKRSYFLVDNGGKLLATKEDKDLNGREFDQPSMIFPLANDFVVLKQTRDKKVGYSIERYSSSLELKYVQTNIPERKKLYPVDLVFANNIIYVLESYSQDMTDNFDYHISGFNVETGARLFDNVIKSADEKSFGIPTFMKVTPSGSVVTGGMYFNGPKEQEANSDGFFSAMVGSDGKSNYVYKSWKEVFDQIKDKNTGLLFGGKTKVFLHDIVINQDGSFTLVSETFRRGSEDLAGGKKMGALTMTAGSAADQPDELAVTISDFALFDFNADNTFKGVRKIAKPVAVTIIKGDASDAPAVGTFKGLNLAHILNNKGYFPYRMSATKEGVNYMVYQMTYSKLYTEKLYFTPLNTEKQQDTVAIDITNSIYKVERDLSKKVDKKMGKLATFANKMNSANGTDIQNTCYVKNRDNYYSFRTKNQSSRVLPANVDGKVLIYDFEPELIGDDNQKKNMLAQYSADMNSAVNAKLRVYYLDIPVSK